MVVAALKELYTRDLNRLKAEIDLYKDEATLWKTENSIKNSGGNLCLHLIGNLKHFIGNGLAQTGYVRDREFEFAGKFVDRKELQKGIDEAIEIVNQGLDNVTDEQLMTNVPTVVWERDSRVAYTIIHLHAHLNYHLGQINYHRRMLEQENDAV